MTWLLAVALRPLAALVLFGGAAYLAVLIRPLVPQPWRSVLYDRAIRQRHPWKFFLAACVGVYGTVLLVAWAVGYL